MSVCARIEPELSAFLDAELNSDQARAVAAHIDHCPACAATIDRLRAVGSVLRRWDAEETRYATTNAFRARVLSRVGPEVAPVAPVGLRAHRAASTLLLVRAAAAALVVVSLGAAYTMIRQPEPGPELMARLERRLLALELSRTSPPVERSADLGAIPHADAGASWLRPLRPLETVVTPGLPVTTA